MSSTEDDTSPQTGSTEYLITETERGAAGQDEVDDGGRSAARKQKTPRKRPWPSFSSADQVPNKKVASNHGGQINLGTNEDEGDADVVKGDESTADSATP